MKTEHAAAPIVDFAHPPTEVPANRVDKTRITRVVTTSWDDGDSCDLRIAEKLATRRMAGTFYVPVMGHVEPHLARLMSLKELRELSSLGFEIGAHGISHPNLPGCDEKQLSIEVGGSKKRMEDDLGKRVSMFAYPRGRHNGKVIASLKQAGFVGGRTTAMLARALTFDPFRMPTTVQVFPHSRLNYFKNLARAWDVRRTKAYASYFPRVEDWVELAKILFDSILRSGGLWHLYGHSWEIEKFDLWDDLDEVLDYVSNRPGVHYLANGPVVDLRAENLA